MRRVLNSAILAVLLLASPVAATTPTARAAVFDGNWSVLIITEKGECDRGYRYSVSVANGHVRYQGGASVDLSGTVAPNGVVRVVIRLGEQGAMGAGRLSVSNGAGTWHGIGPNASCAGRWEAERR